MNESTQTRKRRYKRCRYCGGEDDVNECGQPIEDEAYISNWGKRHEKPKDKMRRRHEDK